MPNHWRTKVVFSKTPSKALKQFLADCETKKTELCEFVCPKPALLKHTACGGRSFETPAGTINVASWYSNSDTREERPFTPAEQAELAGLGATDWYEWACRTWGTKWGTYNSSYQGKLVWYFDSAWGPPTDDIFQRFADHFQVTFKVYGHDEGESIFTPVGAFGPIERDTMTVEEILDVIDPVYPDGLIKLCAKEKSLKAMIKHGDSLAAFIVTEIRETYDAKEETRVQLAQARRAIENAKMELDKVIDALENEECSI